MTYYESCDSPPYFQHLPAPTNHPIYKAMLINQVLVDSVLRTNYLIIILTLLLFEVSISTLPNSGKYKGPERTSCLPGKERERGPATPETTENQQLHPLSS